MSAIGQAHDVVSISPLLKNLANSPSHVTAEEISSAFALIFENDISGVQLAAFLTLLHSTGKERDPEVLAKCAARMREAASTIDVPALLRRRAPKQGSYQGGLCDIVGTGGDSHSTFNISTTASIIASPLLMMAKHGNRAQTSLSGSADVLNALKPRGPNLAAMTAEKLPSVYDQTNYAFLFAPNFHPGMRYAAPIRRELGLRTIFNLLGPLANPVDAALEARVVGVAKQELGPIFAEALRLSGVRRAMVVCGKEDLDEISCAGETSCWRLKGPTVEPSNQDDEQDSEDEYDTSRTEIETFNLHPRDFGLPTHALSEVGGGKRPDENAEILMQILKTQRPADDPILDFVLLNVAALLVVAGVCDDWVQGVDKARWCIESGKALHNIEVFIEETNKLS